MASFTFSDLEEDPYYRQVLFGPYAAEEMDMFVNSITCEEETAALEVWQPIVVESRDAGKCKSLISVIEEIVTAPDCEEWIVEPYYRQQIVLDEIGKSEVLVDIIEDIVFPEVGVERLTEKKISGLSYLTPDRIIVPRINENLMTHCVESHLGDQEAVVFMIQYKRGKREHYLWNGTHIRRCGATKPLWLTVRDGIICNRTNDYVEDSTWVLPIYRYPGFEPDKNYYVWINGLTYSITSHHIFTLRCKDGFLYDKSDNQVGGAVSAINGIYSVEYPTMRLLCKTKRGVDGPQVIKSALAAGVSTKRLIEKYPELRGVREEVPKLERCARPYPDTRFLGIQYIGDSHALVRYKIREMQGYDDRKVIIGHNIYPAFIEDHQLARIHGKLYTKRRRPHAKQKIVMTNKLKVPMGVWFSLEE